jgi:hypothetical protein
VKKCNILLYKIATIGWISLAGFHWLDFIGWISLAGFLWSVILSGILDGKDMAHRLGFGRILRISFLGRKN